MKNPAIELTAAARLDLLQIWNYFADEASIAAADQVLADLETAIDKLADRPSLGHKRPDLTKRRLLFYLVHTYLVIYRPETIPLRVIRVLHAKRDIQGILAKN